MIVLTAYATFLPEKMGPSLTACLTVRDLSVKEPGCERYDFFQSSDEPNKIVFVEEWTSRKDLDLHFEQDAFKTFFATIQELLAAPPEIRIFESTLQD